MGGERVRSLRREVGLLGAFSMGFADVGADVFLAIGIVTLYAGGVAPIAFLLASICYITTGLVYAELAPLYPYAGGGQVYGMRAGGDMLGFMVGWAILLDYILDIGLFSIISAGYLSFLFPGLNSYIHIELGLFSIKLSVIGLVAFILVILLIGINLIGIRESSRLNEILVLLTLSTEIIILILAFTLAFNIDLFTRQLSIVGNPNVSGEVFYTGLTSISNENFIYGVTLAMSSFIGIESIAQAAEETRNPWRYLPKSFKYSIVTVIFFTLSFSILGLGVLGWLGLSEAIYNPIAAITAKIPIIGYHLSMGVALIAFLITLVSTNTGVIGVSRVSYSMSKYSLIPEIFSKLHYKSAVPYISIIVFGLLGGLLALSGHLEMVASLYNFGALLSYMLVNYSHIKIRMKEGEDAYRPWMTPLNIRFRGRNISIIAILGVISTSILFTLVVIYHPIGRILGFTWVGIGLATYILYRYKMGIGPLEDYSTRRVEPAITKLKTIVVTPPSIKPDLIYKTIYNNLEDIHDIYLVSIIELPHKYMPGFTINWMDIYRLKRDLEANLDEACSMLRSAGYSCRSYVIIGSREMLANYINNVKGDILVWIVGKRPRLKGKKEYLSNLSSEVSIIYLYIPEVG